MININGDELPDHISYSSLTDYPACGYMYYLNRVKQVKEIPAWWLFGGIAVYKASETLDKDIWKEEHDKH